MLKEVLFTFLAKVVGQKRTVSLLIVCAACFGTNAMAQTDSTDLALSMTPAVLVTSLDSILYGDGTFEELTLDFSISDRGTFSKVHVTLEETGTSNTVFKKSYSLSDLGSEGLLSSWDVSLPFGNLSNVLGYYVTIIIEERDGSLGSEISKTLNP